MTNTAEKEKKDIRGNSYKESIEIFKKIKSQGANLFGGMGEMGSKAYSTLLRAGIPTSIQDVDPKGTRESQLNTITTLEKGVKRKKISEEQIEQIRKRRLIRDAIIFPHGGHISFDQIKEAHGVSEENGRQFVEKFLEEALGSTTLREEYCNGMFVIEAGPENLGFKQGVFEFFSLALKSEDAILASNTSSLVISEIGARVRNKKRIVGYHYFLPAHINPLVEIIVSRETSDEVAQAMLHLASAMGKKPIICKGDSPGAVANRILVGVLNEAAKIFDETKASYEEIDQAFLDAFYEKQIKVQTSRAQNQFKAAPKLSYFADEVELYKKIEAIDEEIKLAKTEKEVDKLLVKKESLVSAVDGKLRQKVLYASIVENHSRLGSFFKASPSVGTLKQRALDQLQKIKAYTTEVKLNWDYLKTPFVIEPFKMPESNATKTISKVEIINRLKAAYIAISMQIFNEGLADIQDIEISCKDGFKWNTGPFEMAFLLGSEKTKELISNLGYGSPSESGIVDANTLVSVSLKDLSGIRTYRIDNVGVIEIGKLHIQQLQQMQNSLSPHTLLAIEEAIEKYESDSSVKSILFKSQGGGPFSAGADLDYLENIRNDIDKAIEYIQLGDRVMDKIDASSKPTVVILDGPAVGGGAELALACDYRVMSETSYIAFPEVALGIIPRWGGTQRLPRSVGKTLAKAMITTATLDKSGFKLGARLSANECVEVGFAHDKSMQSDMPILVSQLLNREHSSIDIFVKPQKENNYNKSDYSDKITAKFKLKTQKPIRRFLDKYAEDLAKRQIENSDDPSYKAKSNDDKKLIKQGISVIRLCIAPLIWAVQNKTTAKILEALKLA